jgi:hypothetical protein
LLARSRAAATAEDGADGGDSDDGAYEDAEAVRSGVACGCAEVP